VTRPAAAARSASTTGHGSGGCSARCASGTTPAILVPDNPKVGVTTADRYEPVLQRSYEELASHDGAVVITYLCSRDTTA